MNPILQEKLSENLSDWPKITKAYERLFDELTDKKYLVRSVYEHYVEENGVPDPNKITVVLRIDVDRGFHLSWPLALQLKQRGLTASHYFLPHTKRYYDLWSSEIPSRIAALGQEVGLHYDHYYEQLAFGIDGLAAFKSDVGRLASLIGGPVHGAIYHGHTAINQLGVTNWELTKNLESSELGLSYHDGLKSCYIAPGASSWRPKCDVRMSDFMGVSGAWGWNYFPNYPLNRLRKLGKPGKCIHIAFHTRNVFEYWNCWPDSYGEEVIAREPTKVFYSRKFKIGYKMVYNFMVAFIPSNVKAVLKRILQKA